ncbi:antibiotic biosynthesis monooxygenase family protein [Bradyrhizobium monzae]|uniref:antibiotic biosynthesis monooxygenase family protein n=1 Tax=Bradyrhizobium sp. Oc8 TaxID=2876780 RepID=UPI001F2C34DF|nr:antibiotic biosynthesis monooxygenase [Bradyrhizobium sp. Oc8]
MKAMTTINTLLVKPGRIEEFVAAQRSFAEAMANRPNGLIGGRMYRSIDGSKAVLISQFQSTDEQAAVFQSPEFAAHLAKLRDMVEASSPDAYQEAYTYGAFK